MSAALPTIPGYDVQAEIGRGGMGVVYRVSRHTTGEVLALKMILCGRDATFQELARFRIEAEALACLDHPNIIHIRDVGVFAGCPFFALEFAERGSLGHYLRARRPDPRWSAELVRTLALAMQHAHGRGMLHRDLKPANVLLMADEMPKITDFGLVKFAAPLRAVSDACCTFNVSILDQELLRFAREFREQYAPLSGDSLSGLAEFIEASWKQCAERTGLLSDRTQSAAIAEFVEAIRRPPPVPVHSHPPNLDELTRDGSVMGSPQYMAPEQAAGELNRIGRHTDVYGLGAILYELFTGRPPFAATGWTELLNQVLATAPAPPRQFVPALDPRLEAICLRCLEKDIRQRYPTAAALAADLQRFLGDAPSAAEPSSASQTTQQRAHEPTRLEAPAVPSQPASTRSWWPFRRPAK
jgi:serine/threonine protein kinase